MAKNRNNQRRASETMQVQTSNVGADVRSRIASLLVVQGSDSDLGTQIVCDRPITIGRDANIELPLRDNSISRNHCRVERDEKAGQFVLVDMGSTNGTTVNNHKVKIRYPLAAGDKIFLGSSVVRFNLSDEVDLEYQSKLSEMVYTDSLTGLGSRRHYDAIYEALCERANTEFLTISLMVMDMDGLKKVNDTYGHEAGGFCIQKVSEVIRTVLAQYGTVCRFGGDEFVGCFPNMDQKKAMELAEVVRKKVVQTNIVIEGKSQNITLSTGIATYPVDMPDPEQLFRVADRALYLAKRLGRNQVCTPVHPVEITKGPMSPEGR